MRTTIDMDWFPQVIAKIDNVAILILLVVNVGLFYMWREDRKAMVEALNKNTEALVSLRLIVAAITGKP